MWKKYNISFQKSWQNVLTIKISHSKFMQPLTKDSIFTARVRSTTGGYFSQVCVCSTLGGVPHPYPSLSGGGYPIQPWTGGVPRSSLGWGEYPNLGWGGTPTLDRGVPQPWTGGHPISGGGTPSHVWLGTPPKIASTCYGYAAGGVPLAFTQEDFLVLKNIHMTSPNSNIPFKNQSCSQHFRKKSNLKAEWRKLKRSFWLFPVL